MSDLNKNKSGRGKAVPVSRIRQLEFAPRAGYRRRLVNEVPGAVNEFLKAGWSLVKDESADISDPSMQKGSNLGTDVIRRVVNRDPRAPCHSAVLMEIPEEDFADIQAYKDAELERIEQTWDPKKSLENFGNLTIQNGSKEN